ncbi:PREDICTED: zinc finger protein 658-like [Papilio polytes]|uniref:zinc finger protein 658-like n=1 Tax=Papilio polytes TaxID=76194 RepID=UPI000675EEBA|nr:PREDICTED: zinc finger protein 658-like [Papilio polytes]
MRCCAPNCKNDTRQLTKSQGITFHVIPAEQTIRASWLKALGKETWVAKERSAVCSEHFSCDDLYETRGGLRKIKPGAVPVIKDAPVEEMQNLKVCRICLAMDRRLYSIHTYQLDQAYEYITGLNVKDNLPQSLCSECAHRLLSCQNFRRKTLRSFELMMGIVDKQEMITEQKVQDLNKKYNLESKLTTKYYKPDHYDIYIEYKENTEGTEEIELEIKNEIFLDETGSIKDENYSSDDSVPLEKRRTKKKVVKKKKEPTEPKIDRRRKPFLNDDLNETLFTITDLSVDEQIAEIEKRRESSNYKKSVFKCTACFKGFLDEDAYNSHMTRHTDQCGEYECEICKIHFKHSHALRKHVTAHHTQRFSCNQCNYVTTHRQTARLHERWHKGTKYQCPHCQEEFLKFTTYMGHIRIKHPSDFVCELCGYSFVSEKGIELHKKLKHRLESDKVPEDGPLCTSCDVRFISEEAYRKHLMVSAKHNTGDKDSNDPNKPKKGRKPRGRREIRDRRDPNERKMYPSQMRKVEGPIPCEQCGVELEDSRAYHGHFRRMHPDKNRTNYPSMKSPCMCELCGRMFQSYALLKDHSWVHTGERPFACESCGKSFRMRQRLVAHRRVHAPRRDTYVCALCGKHFSTHSNRQRHMFIHTGLKPFACEMCGKCFKQASEKRAHVAYVHLKKPWPKRTRNKRTDRQVQLQSQPLSASEMAIVEPVWPHCEQKNEVDVINKPIYFNMKI